MDVGQAGGCVRSPAIHRPPQAEGVPPSGDLPKEQVEVRPDQQRSHQDRHAAPDQS